jgi:hypothetical protein
MARQKVLLGAVGIGQGPGIVFCLRSQVKRVWLKLAYSTSRIPHWAAEITHSMGLRVPRRRVGWSEYLIGPIIEELGILLIWCNCALK